MPDYRVGRSVTFRPSFPIPVDVARHISLYVARRARQLAPKSKRYDIHAASYIRPTYRKGEIGIHIPPPAFYLWFQDQGTKPYTMHSLEGKVIPMRQNGGNFVQFRTAKNVGKRKITSRDERGRIIRSKISWRHPGLAPKHFIQRAFRLGLQDWVKDMTPQTFALLFRHVKPEDLWREYNRWRSGAPDRISGRTA